MSNLSSLLSLGANAIAAQNTGIAVASNNVSNANTEGYSRQRVDLEAVGRSPLVGGVRSGMPDRLSDSLLGGRIRNASSSLEMSKSLSAALGDVESRLTTGPTLSEQLAEMYASYATAAASPTDPIAREAVLSKTHQLVENVRRRAAELAEMHDEFNQRIHDKLQQASDVAAKLASTNLAIAKTGDPIAKDQRDKLAKELSSLVGGQARVDADGQMRFVLDGGAVLVDGTKAAKMTDEVDPVTGDSRVMVVDGNNKRDVTGDIRGGSVGAQVAVRDGTLKQAENDLDQFAHDFATQSNNVHRAHAGLDGTSGRDLFTPPGAVKGAARNLAIDPAIESDPSKLALGAAGGGVGSNSGALAMFQLADQKVATGGKTLGESALGIVSKVAHAASNASADVTRDTLVADHLAGLQDSLSGVDIQEELTNLTRFEHASSAMTKFVSTIDGLLGDLIDRL